MAGSTGNGEVAAGQNAVDASLSKNGKTGTDTLGTEEVPNNEEPEELGDQPWARGGPELHPTKALATTTGSRGSDQGSVGLTSTCCTKAGMDHLSSPGGHGDKNDLGGPGPGDPPTPGELRKPLVPEAPLDDNPIH